MVDVGKTKLSSGITLKKALDIINNANIKMHSLEKSFDANIRQFEAINNRFSAVEQLMLETDLESMKKEFQNVKNHLEQLKQEISKESIVKQNSNEQRFKELASKNQSINDTLEEYKNSINNSIDSLNQKQSSLEDKIQDKSIYENKITQLDLKINNLYDKLKFIDKIEEKLDKMEEEVKFTAIVNQKIETIEKSIADVIERQEQLQEKVSSIKSTESLEIEISSLKNRILNLETKEDITTGEEIGLSLDSFSILKKVIENNLGKEKMNELIVEDKIDDPALIVDLMKKSFLEYVLWEKISKAPNTVEIMLKYSQMGISDKTSIIIAFAKDVRKLLEAGQTVLAAIGIEKARTRNVMEEAKNTVRKWTSDSDVDSNEIGANKIIELLETLNLIYKQ